VALAALSVTLVGCDGPRQPWRHQLASVTADGTDAGGAAQSVMSADGTKVAFVTLESDFGATDTNGTWDVYVRDLTTATTTLVSVDAAGTAAGNGRSVEPAISADGTRIAFQSDADDLGPTDSHQGTDVYVRDLTAGTTTLVSVNAAGTDASTGSILSAPVISPDGTKVVFQTSGGDLGPSDTRVTCLGGIRPVVTFVPCPDVYLRDLTAGTTELLTVNAAGTNGADYGPVADFQPAAVFSPDGSKVALVSTARDLLDTPVCCSSHVFVRDLATDTTVLAPAVPPGTDDPGGARDPAFSPDGSQVAFDSTASDPSGLHHQVFVHDLGTGDTTLVSADPTGTGPGDGPSMNATFGPDGTDVYFQSDATDLVPGVRSGVNVYRRDLDDATTALVVAGATGPAVSADGRFLGFVAQGGGYGPTDTNGTSDIYRIDLVSGTVTLVSTNGEGTDASGSVPTLDGFHMTADGHRFLFESRAADLGPHDTNDAADAYVADLGGADLSLDGTAVVGPVGTPERLVYSLEVANGGPDTAEATKVALALPEGTELSSASGGCAEESRLVICEVGTLAAGTSATVTIRADAGRDVTATSAVASSDTIEVDGADNTRRLSPTAP
jgi:Tol biopolymer transport system component